MVRADPSFRADAQGKGAPVDAIETPRFALRRPSLSPGNGILANGPIRHGFGWGDESTEQ